MTAVTVLQLSDTHFLEPGATPEGAGAYDTSAAFEAVRADIGDAAGVDLIVVTGDVADHGRPAQYRLAGDALARLPVPVNAGPGNHDLDVAFASCLARPGVATSRVVEVGPWAMVFVDSNSGVMEAGPDGRRVDPPDDLRLHSNGALSAAERSWLREVVATTEAEHVAVWVHHPPIVNAMYSDGAYRADWVELLAELPKVRGIGAGHTHVPAEYEIEGRPVFVAPSLKNNFDLDAGTWLPPGYRSYSFAEDGSISSQVHLVDGAAWPRHPMGRALRALFAGELTHAELEAIVRRKAAEAGG